MKVLFHISTDNINSVIEEIFEFSDGTTDEELEQYLREFIINHTDRFFEIASTK